VKPLDKTDMPKEYKDYLDTLLRKIPSIQSGVTGTHIKVVLFGFCGSIRPVYLINKENTYPYKYIASGSPSELEDKYNSRHKDHTLLETNRYHYMFFGGYLGGYRFNDEGHNRFVMEWLAKPICYDIFINQKTPVFLLYRENREFWFDRSPILKDFGIQSIVDPWTAYQEIDRFLGNDLVNIDNKEFQMSDELKRDSKGMDDWSFKQMGPKKRKRK
jgi:hypothetical protein